jgi:hypothetical protein
VALDTLVADTVDAQSITLGDSLLVPLDSVPPDSVVIQRLPPMPGSRPGDDPGLVARWDRDELLRSRAITLQELLAPLPGMVPLRAGDFGAPEGITLDGMAGGRLRVFTDGVEDMPLDGSVPDLAQISLGGIGSVEVTRTGGELRIHLRTLQAESPGPLSLIEAGTGDFDTNVFRGTFIHPSAFGGGLALLFERTDTDGPAADETGSLQNVWLRYMRPLGSRLMLSGEIRSRRVDSELAQAPSTMTRLTRSVRLRGRISDGVAAEVFAAENKLDLTGDSTVAESPRNAHYGGRIGWNLGPSWGELQVRHVNPAGRPNLLRADVDGGFASAAVGGISGRFGWDREGGGEGTPPPTVTRSVWGVSAWTRPLLGLSLFASLDEGERGWSVPAYFKLGLPTDSATLFPSGSDATYLRAGARLSFWRLHLEGAWLSTEVDSILPLGNRVDRGIRAFPGGEATGFQVSGSVGVPFVNGLSVRGSLQQWEEEGILRPGRIYRGGLAFHDSFYPTGNLEIAANFMVEGRDPMLVPLPDPATGDPLRVPFYQSWNADLQIRVVTVRIFIRWDNLFLRPENQDIPGRLLPRTRAMYGVRWTLTN